MFSDSRIGGVHLVCETFLSLPSYSNGRAFCIAAKCCAVELTIQNFKATGLSFSIDPWTTTSVYALLSSLSRTCRTIVLELQRAYRHFGCLRKYRRMRNVILRRAVRT